MTLNFFVMTKNEEECGLAQDRLTPANCITLRLHNRSTTPFLETPMPRNAEIGQPEVIMMCQCSLSLQQ
ncbi:hypothetical protein XmelCFBP4644_18090 [Xanthomonas melonis]|uniref:Uncharacterized protein n=1 Tax=Xanthomonas melonis TaxID=56456 RepID=A0A2S7DAR8_9XANT|nr:hypothetical protein XmelCFBP4644_18090 [Xanthomonas melonis]